MSVSIPLISDLNARATRALVQELGVVDAMRYLNQFRAGQGDYTAERGELFKGESVASIVAKIKTQRADQD